MFGICGVHCCSEKENVHIILLFISFFDRKGYKMGQLQLDRQNRGKGSSGGNRKRKRNGIQKGTVLKSSMNSKSDTPNQVQDTIDHTADSDSDGEPEIKRHYQSFYDDVVKKTPSNEIGTPGADGKDGSKMILRPKPDVPGPDVEDTDEQEKRLPGTGEYNMESGNIVIEKSRYEKLLNSFIKKHADVECPDGLEIETINFRPWGLFVSAQVKCKNCGRESDRANLYEEVETTKPGRKAAVGNVSLGCMIQETGLGPTGTKLLYAGGGLNAGSMTSLQKTQVKVADTTEKMVRVDMNKWLEHTQDVLKARGVDETSQLSAQFDVVYHNMGRSHNNLPGQGASVATALCVETITSQKKIIEYEHVCKICTRGARLRAQDVKTICGHQASFVHHRCTANIPQGQSIREYDMAVKIAKRLASKGVVVTHLTTDSDAKGKEGFQSVNQTEFPDLKSLTWYKDPSHLSRNMRRKILSHSIKGRVFWKKKNGDAWTYGEKMVNRKALSLDVPRRVSLTLSNMRMYYKGNQEKMLQNVDKIREYLIKCYDGDHTSCQSSHIAKLTGCSGGGPGQCWFNRSHTLRAQKITRLQLSQAYREFLHSVIGMKLSKDALLYVARGETSSHCEASNRCMVHRYAKNKKFPRTGGGRIASGVNRMNNGFKKSFLMKCRAMNIAVPQGCTTTRLLSQYQHKRDLTRESQSTQSAKNRRHERIAHYSTLYFNEQLKETSASDYAKNQYDSAKGARDQALQHVVESEPSTSEEYVSKLRRAQGASEHMIEALDKRYSVTESILMRRRAQESRRRATQRLQYKLRDRWVQQQQTALNLDHSYC